MSFIFLLLELHELQLTLGDDSSDDGDYYSDVDTDDGFVKTVVDEPDVVKILLF